jgi:hypothetical protein
VKRRGDRAGATALMEHLKYAQCHVGREDA